MKKQYSMPQWHLHLKQPSCTISSLTSLFPSPDLLPSNSINQPQVIQDFRVVPVNLCTMNWGLEIWYYRTMPIPAACWVHDEPKRSITIVDTSLCGDLVELIDQCSVLGIKMVKEDWRDQCEWFWVCSSDWWSWMSIRQSSFSRGLLSPLFQSFQSVFLHMLYEQDFLHQEKCEVFHGVFPLLNIFEYCSVIFSLLS